MRQVFQKLTAKILRSLDWDSIYETHKIFKFGVGSGSEIIPGLKRKVFSEGLTKNDVRNELKFLIQYVITNDIPRLVYGQWMIFWFNQDWDIVIEQESPEEEEFDLFDLESRLEVIYAPQRIALTVDAEPLSADPSENPEVVTLKLMLKRAEADEDYEIASRIQDLLKLTNNKG